MVVVCILTKQKKQEDSFDTKKASISCTNELSSLCIYEPAEDSYLLERFVREHAVGRVLEIGTGSGILACTAAKSFNVRSVLAVDINPNAVAHVKARKEKEHLKKLNVIQSDLFSELDLGYDGKFDTIIFNPPYLPQDYINGKKIIDPALYGGKKGSELTEKFLNESSDYLANSGKILLLFSSFTDKKKIDLILLRNLFEFEELAFEKTGMMETLYVYLITRNSAFESIFSHGVKSLRYHAKGSRGFVFKGRWDKSSFVKSHIASGKEIDVAIKVRHNDSDAPGTLLKEAKWLKELNQKRIGPRLYYSHDLFLVLEFISGVGLDKYLEKVGALGAKGRSVMLQVLKQCRQMDLLKVSKEEMHRPHSNVIVGEGKNNSVRVTLIDFERCHRDDHPQNVTQFVTFLIKIGVFSLEKGRELASRYKEDYLEEMYKEIVCELVGKENE